MRLSDSQREMPEGLSKAKKSFSPHHVSATSVVINGGVLETQAVSWMLFMSDSVYGLGWTLYLAAQGIQGMRLPARRAGNSGLAFAAAFQGGHGIEEVQEIINLVRVEGKSMATIGQGQSGGNG